MFRLSILNLQLIYIIMSKPYEYLFLDADGIPRGKTRMLEGYDDMTPPSWSYDGSSTGQAPRHDSEIILVPMTTFKDPFRLDGRVVVCENFVPDSTKTKLIP